MTIAEKILRAKADYDAVYEAGKNAGGGGGQGSYDEGYEAGRKAEYDAFWDLIQPNQGAARRYVSAFGMIWHKNNFKPKYNLVPTNATQMFYNFGQDAGLSGSYGVIDLKEHLDALGVILDFSKCTSCNACFSYSTISRVGEVRTDSLTNLQQMFTNANVMVTIDKIISHANLAFTNAFQGAPKLENVTFEGVIAQNGLNFQWSPLLSKASIESIMAALSTTTSGLTVTLSKTAVNNAFTTEEWTALVSQHTNWTISLI